jgi:hypothetical protein
MALNVSLSKTASLVYGPMTESPLNITLSALIEKQAARYGKVQLSSLPGRIYEGLTAIFSFEAD